MICFPFFIPLEGKRGLVVGGSNVALRKIRKLLPYGPHLTVCAPEICSEIRQIPGVDLEQKPFTPALLAGKTFVIAATNQRSLNAYISELCQERNILVNVVDDRELCSFIFPALVQDGDLSIGICTGGASPAAAAYLKNEVQAIVPQRFGELLDWLDAVREGAKCLFVDENTRKEFNKAVLRKTLDNGGPLDSSETMELFLDYLMRQAWGNEVDE